MPETAGIHHVTAITSDPGRNADFYVDTLGLRFVKRTVNHDDTHTYHFSFGDRRGTSGTAITVFPWTDEGRRGEFGAGQTAATAYAVRPESVGYWRDRLADRGVEVEEAERFGESVLSFEDPDGIGLELVGTEAAADAPAEPWEGSPVPAEHQLRGFDGVTLAVAGYEPTERVLTDVLGYELAAEEDGRRRYRTAAGERPGTTVDLVETTAERGRMGVGTVHHVAFKAEDTDAQEAYREAFEEHGLRVSEILDRKYFHAIYAREPGGVLFEVATTGPGFTADEDVEDLGSRLTLPEWLEDDREATEAALPAVETGVAR